MHQKQTAAERKREVLKEAKRNTGNFQYKINHMVKLYRERRQDKTWWRDYNTRLTIGKQSF